MRVASLVIKSRMAIPCDVHPTYHQIHVTQASDGSCIHSLGAMWNYSSARDTNAEICIYLRITSVHHQPTSTTNHRRQVDQKAAQSVTTSYALQAMCTLGSSYNPSLTGARA